MFVDTKWLFDELKQDAERKKQLRKEIAKFLKIPYEGELAGSLAEALPLWRDKIKEDK